MPPDSEGDYEVGYGKPPRETRFAKGQSGNPRGRPSGAKNFATLLREALNEPVIITENGGRRKVSKRQAIITQLVNRSATADFRAIKILLDIVRDIERIDGSIHFVCMVDARQGREEAKPVVVRDAHIKVHHWCPLYAPFRN